MKTISAALVTTTLILASFTLAAPLRQTSDSLAAASPFSVRRWSFWDGLKLPPITIEPQFNTNTGTLTAAPTSNSETINTTNNGDGNSNTEDHNIDVADSGNGSNNGASGSGENGKAPPPKRPKKSKHPNPPKLHVGRIGVVDQPEKQVKRNQIGGGDRGHQLSVINHGDDNIISNSHLQSYTDVGNDAGVTDDNDTFRSNNNEADTKFGMSTGVHVGVLHRRSDIGGGDDYSSGGIIKNYGDGNSFNNDHDQIYHHVGNYGGYKGSHRHTNSDNTKTSDDTSISTSVDMSPLV